MKTHTRKEFVRTCVTATAGLALARKGRAAESSKAPEEKSMIACCGLDCAQCPAYIATWKNDDKLRAETAKKWSTQFNVTIEPADVNCDGCTSDSDRLINHCRVCEIRKCSRERKLANCALCPEYPCAKLSAFLANVPAAKANLEAIRGKGN
jgi:hypothetical protein